LNAWHVEEPVWLVIVYGQDRLSPLQEAPGVIVEGQEPTLLQAAIAIAITTLRGRKIFMLA
jgi:hypothetical protein